ncbi:Aste57867_20984 [Aphanomyces stellatus]|uniref:Aste57867_20984 protein n=1 Tax=Aphanomyces stellatus TaxID=120398 RepID=A0A485LGZ0_9STRA|nr:hypothetical protein As57867_020916 [Aphanomyces stellatus]VFT97659.1 Aste57867_20984 [Aphanomyces stellatus]
MSLVVCHPLAQVHLSRGSIDLPHNVPPTVKYLGLNTQLALVGVNCTNITVLRPSGATRISGLSLPKSLTFMFFFQSVVDHWTMSSETFDALSQLTPTNELTYYYGMARGVHYESVAISTSQADCDAADGTLRELWPHRPILTHRLHSRTR